MPLNSSPGKTSTAIDVVMPVFNKRALLPTCLDSIFAAASRHPAVNICLVDNGSSDGSFEYLASAAGDRVTILRLPGRTIGALRNLGSRQGAAPIVSFLDCDCTVPPDFFVVLEDVFASTGAAAAGRRIVLPPNPTWVEATWDLMHQDGLDGERTWINSANLAVRRDVFDALNGFDEKLVTGEDAELCQRIRLAGGKVMQDQRLSVSHLDNSKTLSGFFRKERWRGLGMFGTVTLKHVDKPTAMTLAHLAAIILAIGWIVFSSVGVVWRLFVPLVVLFAVPILTVAYRKRNSIHSFNLAAAVVLYELYYLGRINALCLVLSARVRRWFTVARGVDAPVGERR